MSNGKGDKPRPYSVSLDKFGQNYDDIFRKKKNKEMTQKEKNILIAEACGKCPHTEIEYWSIEDGNDYDYGFTCKKCGQDPHCQTQTLPDYFNDLNAIHEAEKILTTDQYLDFLKCLVTVNPDFRIEARRWTGPKDFLVHASASQRAEAFGKTLNLW